MQDDREGVSWKRMMLWLIAALGVTIAAVCYSLRYGRLSAPPDWDDVMYLRYAAMRINDLHVSGIWACIQGWLHNTPHSPFSCGVAFVSFLVFGLKEWPPYIGSGIIVFGYFVLADWVMGRQRIGVKVLTILYLCTIPMLTMAVTDFKPDIAWGLAVGAVAAVCMLRPIVGATTKSLIVVGVLCALAMLAKPTTTPGTIALLGLCGLIGTVKDLVLERRWLGVLPIVRTWVWVFVVMVVCAGPFFYLNWGYFNYYIQQTLFGEYKETWYIAGSWDGWATQFKFFLVGDGGLRNLAGHLYLIIVIWVIGWWAARRDRVALVRAGGLLVITLACYLMPTLNPAKNPLVASPFYAMVIVMTAYWIGYVAARRPTWNRGVVGGLLAMIVIGFFLYRWPSVYYGPGGSDRADSGRLHHEVYEALLKQVKPYPQLTTVMGTGPVREITLSWYATCDREPLMFDRPYSSKLADYVPYMDRSDFVLAQEDHVRGSIGIMPNEQVQGEVLKAMRQREDYRVLTEFRGEDGKELVLFQRTNWSRGVMSGLRPVDGFGPVQGPYPTSNPALPMFIYGHRGGSGMLLVCKEDGQAGSLQFEARASDHVAGIRVLADGKELGVHRIAKPWTEEVFSIPLPKARNGMKIRLEYLTDGKSPEVNAVLFTRIGFVPAGLNVQQTNPLK
jgi:hypothetical protein